MLAELSPNNTVLLPSPEATIADLREALPIVPAQPGCEATDSVTAYAPVTKLTHGGFYVPFAGLAKIDGEIIDPAANAESEQAFAAAREALQANDFFYHDLLPRDGRWWLNPGLKRVQAEETMREVWHVTTDSASEPRTLEVLNCSPETLDEAEQSAFLETLDAVSNLTEGKIYDRVKGVIFCGDDVLEDDRAAEFSNLTGVLLINIAQARQYKGIVPNRYKQYFKEGDDLLALKILIAHELGHAMDIRTVTEATNHGIQTQGRDYTKQGDKILQCSAFDELPGWTVTQHQGEYFTSNLWHFDDAGASELDEYPVNEYAASKPSEDFAETFAIVALGGKTAGIPTRQSVIRRTLQLTEGRAMPPHHLELTRVAKAGELYTPQRKLSQICLQACVV